MQKVRTIVKNHYLFQWLSWRNENAAVRLILDLVSKYNPSKFKGFKPEIILLKNIPRENKLRIFTDYKIKQKATLETIKKWPKIKIADFFNDIDDFLEKMELGSEWRLTIMTVVLECYFFPPFYNFNIIKKKTKKSLILELSGYTTLDDIKDAWKDIQQHQKELWPNYRKWNFTKKSMAHLNLFVKDMLMKGSPNKINDDDTGTKKEDRLTDIDKVGRLYDDWGKLVPREVDEKRVANLRQVRRRFKHK